MNQMNHREDAHPAVKDESGDIPSQTGTSPDVSSDAEWDNRVLCRDESCIGVIGPDGRCKECGLPYDGPRPDSIESSAVEAPVEKEPEPASAPQKTPANIDAEWENRILCRDESCIGVIGPDGRCKECGKPYEDGG